MFIGKNPDDYSYMFGSSMELPSHSREYTSPEKILNHNIQLRKQIIYMAIENGDISMLDKMKARETYVSHCIVYSHWNEDKGYEQYLDSHLIECIVSSDSQEIIDYFSDSFIIGKYQLFFPFINEMIKLMIEKNSPYLENVLSKILDHNIQILKIRQMCFEDIFYTQKNQFNYEKFNTFTSEYQEFVNQCIMQNILSAYSYNICANKLFNLYRIRVNDEVHFTTIIHINSSSDNSNIQQRIDDINSKYDSITTFADAVSDMVNERLKPVSSNKTEDQKCSK